MAELRRRRSPMPDAGKERAAAARRVHAKRYPAPPVDIVHNGGSWSFESPFRSADEEDWWRLLGEAFGTRTKQVIKVFMDQIAGLVGTAWDTERGCMMPDGADIQAALSIVAALKPRNEAEAAQAAQAFALHLASMKVGAGIAVRSNVDPRQANALANLVKAYTGTMDSMRKRGRSGSTRQTIVVKKDVRIFNDNRSVTLGGGGSPGDNRSHAAGADTRARQGDGLVVEGRTYPVEAGAALLGAPEALAGTLPGACHAEQGGVPVSRRTGGRA